MNMPLNLTLKRPIAKFYNLLDLIKKQYLLINYPLQAYVIYLHCGMIS